MSSKEVNEYGHAHTRKGVKNSRLFAWRESFLDQIGEATSLSAEATNDGLL